jgi:hypothetical protein
MGDMRINWAMHYLREQLEGGILGKTSDLNDRKASQDEWWFTGRADSKDQSHTICPQTATDKGQNP